MQKVVLFWAVMDCCIGLYWTVVGYNYSGLYWAVMDCNGLYWAVLGFNALYLAYTRCTGLEWALLGYTWLYWTVLGCTGLYWGVLTRSSHHCEAFTIFSSITKYYNCDCSICEFSPTKILISICWKYRM